MKKTLLLLLIAGVWGTSQAQNSATVKPKTASVTTLQLAQARIKASQTAEQKSASQQVNHTTKRPHKLSAPPPYPQLGSSANVNGVRDATTTAVTANQACGLMVMTHREDYSKEGTCGTGAYEAAYSVNNGTTWDTNANLVSFCNTNATQGSRYPNGVLFNPAGNTTAANVVDAMAGPWTNGATTGDSWVESCYGSVSIGGGSAHGAYWANGSNGVFTQNTGDLSFMSSSDDSTVHVIGEGFDVNASGVYTRFLGAVLTTGKFNGVADSFQWHQTLFYPHLVPSVKNWNSNVGLTYDSSAAPLATPGTAWSQDGKTGYVVIFGNLDSSGFDYASDQPIVYKTTNSGATWTMMPPFNFGTLSNLTTYLYPSLDSSVKTPLFYTFVVSLTGQSYAQGAENDYDMTVDMNGNLHIFSAILSSAYSQVDSAYTLSWYLNQHGYIYDVSTNGSSGWNARYIDSMQNFPTHVITSSESGDWLPSSTSSVAFGNRLQASRTTDGTHIFCTWLDDFSGNQPDSIVAPDVKGQGYDVANNTSTASFQLTSTQNNYYLCVSDIVMTSGSGPVTYTIPCTIVYPENIPNDGSTAMNYFYLNSVKYTDDQFASGIASIAKPGFSITPNYPNPFSNVTYFNVNLTSESEVTVNVYNVLGEQVSTIGSQRMSSGTHQMTINGNGWNSGVYFYKVTVNGESITQKMMVK
ncbi:MAG TPA: T9SS type A sorting domain-containing protein [Bacteroidia bacterium]|nr:T9SS type A sorting domain-containing protein [Bacteroidia bacterium]